MAKTYIGMILAGSLAVTSFAGHTNAKRMFSKLNWSAAGAASVNSVKIGDLGSTRSHNMTGYLGLGMKGFAAHLNVSKLDAFDAANADDITLDDMTVSGKYGAMSWSVARVGARGGFGESLNSAANSYMFGGRTLNAGWASSSLTVGADSPVALKRDVVSFGTNMNQFNMSASFGKANDATDLDVNGVSFGTSSHGFNMKADYSKYDNDASTVKNDVWGLGVSTKMQNVALMANYSQNKIKEPAASAAKQKWFGLRATTKMNQYNLGAQVEQLNLNSGVATDKKPRSVSFSIGTALNASANMDLGYMQLTNKADKKTKITSLRISAHV